MGYMTTYTLSAMHTITTEEAIADLVDTCEEAAYCLARNGDSKDSSKWYSHEEDLAAHSAANPGILFTLSGEGEDAEDIWKKYFLNGKVQVAKAEITIPAPDIKALLNTYNGLDHEFTKCCGEEVNFSFEDDHPIVTCEGCGQMYVLEFEGDLDEGVWVRCTYWHEVKA